MATYYVDYAAGSDAAVGTDSGNPWKHCPSDSRATENANITLSSGDTIIFKRGVTYTGAGSAGSPVLRSQAANVTYTVSASWGTGQAILNTVGDEAFIEISHSNNSILGLTTAYELKFTGTSCVNEAVFFGGSSLIDGVTVKYVEFDSIGTVSTNQGIGIKFGDGSTAGEIKNGVIQYNYFHGCASYGLKSSGGSGGTHDVDVSYNTFTSNGGLDANHLEMNISTNVSPGAYNFDVHHNTFSKGASAYDGVEFNNAPNKVHDNTFDGYRYALRIDPSYNANSSGYLEIYRNVIKNSTERGINIGGTSAGHGVIKAYNNLFINNTAYVINFPGTADGNEFYFNTFYQTGGHTFWFQTGATGNIIKNNIVFSTGGCYEQADAAYSNNTEDYNIFYRADGGTTIVVGGSSYTGVQLAAYQAAASPNGAHTKFSNPLLKNPPTDLSLQVSSPAIDSGIDVGIEIDYIGTVRPQGAGWDIGAYESIAGGLEMDISGMNICAITESLTMLVSGPQEVPDQVYVVG